MSDQRLRALERRWQVSGSAEDRRALVLERVRAEPEGISWDELRWLGETAPDGAQRWLRGRIEAGVLSEAQARLAGDLGGPCARAAALGEREGGKTSRFQRLSRLLGSQADKEDTAGWFERMIQVPGARGRAALAVCRVLVDRCPEADPEFAQVLAQAEQAVASGLPAPAALAGVGAELTRFRWEPHDSVSWALRGLCVVLTENEAELEAAGEDQAWAYAWRTTRFATRSGLMDGEEVKATIREDLVPWLLGF